jgi:hypothetical protein
MDLKKPLVKPSKTQWTQCLSGKFKIPHSNGQYRQLKQYKLSSNPSKTSVRTLCALCAPCTLGQIKTALQLPTTYIGLGWI